MTLPEDSNLQIGRRTLLSRLKIAAGSLGLSFAAQSIARSAQEEAPAHPTYPKPEYIPSGFTLHNVVWDPPDGFGGGSEERVLVFSKGGLDAQTHRNVPLTIYTSTVKRHVFGTTAEAVPTVVSLHLSSGASTEGEYFDGWWMSDPNGERVLSDQERLHWDTSDVHSLVFENAGMYVGIRGSRRKGISRDELIRVAQGLQWPPHA
jgi:hypothetical protein